MRRPLWFGAGVATGAGMTLWAQVRLRRRMRRTLAVLAPTFTDSEAVRSAREAVGRLREAVDAARVERHRRGHGVRRREMVKRGDPGRTPSWPPRESPLRHR
jgi:hypothetical protein